MTYGNGGQGISLIGKQTSVSSELSKYVVRMTCMKVCSRAAILSLAVLFRRFGALGSSSSERCTMASSGGGGSSSSNSVQDQVSSIHSDHIGEEHDVPMDAILRPLPSQLDEEKVVGLMKALKDPVQRSSVPAIDVLWVQGEEGGNYYFAFGGCHRWEAHKRIHSPTIRAKLVKSTEKDLATYLGASTPRLK